MENTSLREEIRKALIEANIPVTNELINLIEKNLTNEKASMNSNLLQARIKSAIKRIKDSSEDKGPISGLKVQIKPTLATIDNDHSSPNTGASKEDNKPSSQASNASQESTGSSSKAGHATSVKPSTRALKANPNVTNQHNGQEDNLAPRGQHPIGQNTPNAASQEPTKDASTQEGAEGKRPTPPGKTTITPGDVKNLNLENSDGGKATVEYAVKGGDGVSATTETEEKVESQKEEETETSEQEKKRTESDTRTERPRDNQSNRQPREERGTRKKTGHSNKPFKGKFPFLFPRTQESEEAEGSTESDGQVSSPGGSGPASGNVDGAQTSMQSDGGSHRNIALSKAAKEAKDKLVKKAKLLILKHPAILAGLGSVLLLFVIILIILVIIFTIMGKDNNNSYVTDTTNKKVVCTYGAAANEGTTTIASNNIRVELINCQGKKKNYSVLESVDFEKYVLGVALAEMGGSSSESPDEALKAQIIAARNFALTRNQGMCESDPNNCFYGYNASTGVIRMRACENDQVYWDYTQDIYRLARGKVSRYSPEVNAGTRGASVWKYALSPERIKHVESVASSIKGEVLMVGSEIVKTDYNAPKTAAMRNYAKAGYTYREILENLYGAGKLEGKKCTQAIIDNSNYQLSTSNSEILSIPLSEFLASKGTSLEALNSQIYTNVKNAGYATRAGVAAAAVSLIGELGNKYNTKLPYYWGGGHGDVSEGASGEWGSDTCHTTHDGNSYDHCGLDCSGFVTWAIYNGGFRYISHTANDFVNVAGAAHVSLSINPILQPGDLLYNSGHVVLIVDIDSNNKEYICAAASNHDAGVEFTRVPFNASNYDGVDLTAFYDNSANQRG